MQPTKQRILCVDNHASRNLAVFLLTQANFEVSTADSMIEALQLAESTYFDLYLLNHQLLQEAEGELCDKLRGVTPHTPMLCYSTVTYPFSRRRAVECDQQDHPMKPVAVTEVVEHVSEALKQETKPTDVAAGVVTHNSVSPTVMVVEDYDDTRYLLKLALEARGYRVVEATDGWQAVKVATSEHPDLILMDINLPVFDGLTATDMLRKRAELADVPIVAMTAYDSAETRADAVDVGCQEYLAKPVDVDQLQNVLKRLLT